MQITDSHITDKLPLKKEYELAIIVPAWKTNYLKESIDSILSQSDQRFQLYIFDDASPFNIESVLKSAGFWENVQYLRYTENMGQKSLVRHWNRCIADTADEKWIWLFSDDDIMGPKCVESFYNVLEKHPGFAAYRFNTRKIGHDGSVIRENNFPEVMDAVQFLNLKLSYSQESYMVETIFSRNVFNAINGIPDLPLAWASDDLFHVKLALNGNIRTIPDGLVFWRYSDSNISGKKNREAAKIKIGASQIFIKWILSQGKLKDQLNPSDLPLRWYIRQIRSLGNQLTLLDEWKAVSGILFHQRSVLKHYFKMKKERSKLVAWLRRFSL